MNVGTKPITPDDVVGAKVAVVPDAVFDAFNDLIALSWDGTQALVMQSAAVALIRKKMAMPPHAQVDMRWLDVEPAYRDAGWSVEYDKPGYNESYAASFTFKRKR